MTKPTNKLSDTVMNVENFWENEEKSFSFLGKILFLLLCLLWIHEFVLYITKIHEFNEPAENIQQASIA